MIAVQLDNMTKDDLLQRGKRIAQRWSAWLTIDGHEKMINSVVWRPVRSGASATRMICGTCRTDTSKKCCHEIACEMESQVSIDEATSSDKYCPDFVGKEVENSEGEEKGSKALGKQEADGKFIDVNGEINVDIEYMAGSN